MSAAKERFCWVCGASMGFIEARHYDRREHLRESRVSA